MTRTGEQLLIAIRKNDKELSHRLSQQYCQEIANEFSRISRVYGGAFHGVVLAVAESFVESLKQTADAQDIKIYHLVRGKSTVITYATPVKREEDGI